MIKFGRSQWGIVIGSMIGMIVGTGAITKVTSSLFLKPVTEHFGWSRGDFSSGILIASIMIIIMQPIFGWMIDKYGVRRAALPFIPLMAAVLVALSMLSGSIAAFFAIYLVFGVASAAQSPPLYTKVVSTWFDRDRGLALAIATSGASIGYILLPLYAQSLIDHFGWRTAYIGIGVANLVLVMAVVGFLLREPDHAQKQGEAQQTASGAATQADRDGIAFRDALRMSKFWVLAAVFLLMGMGLNGTIIHQVALLTDRGWTASSAVQLVAASGLANVAGRFASGWILDRSPGPGQPALFILLPSVGCLLLATGWSGLAPIFAVMLLAFAYGADVDVMAYFTSRYFGLKNFGQIYGSAFSAFALGSGLGPIVMGRSFDDLGSYTPALVLNAGILVVTFVLVRALGAYRFSVAGNID